jgi:SAM-dependent methyltransferase
LAGLLGLDGSGRLLDVGCGPGILTLEVAGLFEDAVGLDADAGMVAEGARRCAEAGVDNVRWVQAVGEDIPALDLGRFRLVTFGQSLHWMDRDRVVDSVYDLLVPGGAIALIAPTVEGRPQPESPGYPLVPFRDVNALIRKYLGPTRRAGQGAGPPAQPDRFEHVLRRSRFGHSSTVFAPGRADIVHSIDDVIAGQLSMSYSAPHLYGDRLAEFEAELRDLLSAASPTGLFWDWPGDTEMVIARKPA